MLKAFQEFIKSQGMATGAKDILLAVSGGVDSMVMADLFHKSGISVGIAHCNFKLRDADSDMDEDFVRDYALQLGLRFHHASFDTSDHDKKRGISIQMAARDLRYRWFDMIISEHGYATVATAHHRNDEFETMLFNLFKGTGIEGLTGMRPMEKNRIRPLLFASRVMIQSYAESNDIKWREDASNSDLRYHRNRIRHEIISVIEKINPGFLESFGYSKRRFNETSRALKQILTNKPLIKTTKTGSLFIEKSSITESAAPTLALYHELQEYGFNYRQCVSIVEAIDSVGKLFSSNTHTLNIDRSQILLTHDQNQPETEAAHLYETSTGIQFLNKTFSIDHIAGGLDQLPDKVSPKIAYLDSEKLSFPLVVRKWRHGDQFVRLGMTGQKNLSDFMIDIKIPVNLKREVLVVESFGTIAWVVGQRIDNRYKLSPSTRGISKISYEEN